MKKLLYAFALLALIGCTVDDESDGGIPITEANILGKWYIKGGSINGGTFQDYENDCPTSQDFQEFFANHDLQFVGYNVDCEASDSETSSWSLSNNRLTVVNSGPVESTQIFTIYMLTDEELVLESTYNTPEGTVTELSNFARH